MKSHLTLVGVLVGMVLIENMGAGDENPFAAYEKAAKPGDMHKKLEPTIGEWTWNAKFWMKPDEKPMESTGTTSRKWIMDGRFVVDDTASKGPLGDFKGQGITGYDNTLKKYVGTWIDTMSSGIAKMTGSVDKDGKVFTYETEASDPISGKVMKGRDVMKILSNDEHVLEAFKVLPDGKEMKVMELHFKRAKK